VSDRQRTVTEPKTEIGRHNLQRYAGEWVVLHLETVIEHGPDLVEVTERARTRGIHCPRVLYVEPHREGEVKLGL